MIIVALQEVARKQVLQRVAARVCACKLGRLKLYAVMHHWHRFSKNETRLRAQLKRFSLQRGLHTKVAALEGFKSVVR